MLFLNKVLDITSMNKIIIEPRYVTDVNVAILEHAHSRITRLAICRAPSSIKMT